MTKVDPKKTVFYDHRTIAQDGWASVGGRWFEDNGDMEIIYY